MTTATFSGPILVSELPAAPTAPSWFARKRATLRANRELHRFQDTVAGLDPRIADEVRTASYRDL